MHDINLALRLNKIETVYGLSEAPDAVIANTNGEASQVTSLISLGKKICG